MNTVGRFFCIIGIFLFGAAGTLWGQEQIIIGASKDNTLYESVTGSTSNGAGERFFVGKTNGESIRRGLLAFDIAANIPSGATITAVTLTLNMSRTTSGAQTVELHRVLANWGEGISNAGSNEGGGDASAPGDATWIHTFFDTTSWANPGGDFEPTVSGSQSVSGVASYVWGSTSQMVGDVQTWLDTPSANFGWIVLGNESTSHTSKRFDTRENANSTARPKLTINYNPLVGVGPTHEQPSSFALHQNYPNPFNPSTTIRYELSQESHAILKIYDILGREVTTLVNAQQSPGTHSIAWNGEDRSGRILGSGLYFYRLTAGSAVLSRMMMLMK